MNSFMSTDTNPCISRMSIEYNNGYFEVFELTTVISRHASLQEAQWIKNVLENEQHE